MGNAQPALPVEQPFVNNLKRVVITGEPEPELPVTFSEEPPDLTKSSPLSNNVDKILNALFRDDEKRLQLWPERLLRAGATAAGDVAAGKVPLWSIDNETGDVHTSPQMIEKAQEISALAGSGGLANPAKGATLNATPSLRPALRHKEKLYKGKPGQEHQDIIPDSLYNDFQKKAMSGDDLAEYNFGFVNDKGHFLSREDALKYGIDNGLIDPQAGKFGTLTSTMFADSSKPGTAIEAMKPTFYSALEHNVGQISQGKMNGEAWLGTLANKPGVKPEELQWTGLKDFLEQNKGKPVTKAQIEEHLAANKVELKEVSKTDKINIDPTVKYLYESLGPATKHITDAASIADARKFNSAFRETTKGMTDEQVLAAARASEKLEGMGDSKYHSYQLPGGENYREMLLTLPDKQKRFYEYEYFDPKTQQSKQFKTEAEAKAAAPEGAVVVPKEVAEINPAYRSSHWDEPNILAHVRMNDRTVDGKKSLHLEEIQSDWHQAGREKGYKGTPLKQAEKDEFNQLNTLPDKVRTPEQSKRLDELYGRLSAESMGVPDAPFKKNWSELAIKRMLREASENGYDRLSWTAGEHHPTNPKNLKQTGEAAEKADKGMQGFYNDIIPKVVEKLGKEHGVKVKTSETNGKKIYYIDIPQSLRDTATQKGFPLFSKGGYMLMPVDYEPEFKK